MKEEMKESTHSQRARFPTLGASKKTSKDPFADRYCSRKKTRLIRFRVEEEAFVWTGAVWNVLDGPIVKMKIYVLGVFSAITRLIVFAESADKYPSPILIGGKILASQ